MSEVKNMQISTWTERYKYESAFIKVQVKRENKCVYGNVRQIDT